MTRTRGRNPNARYEVYSGYRNPARPGTVSQTEDRKFEWRKDALAYAAALPVDDAHAVVNVTVYRAADGWQGQHVMQRRDGAWTALGGTPLPDGPLGGTA